MPDEKKFTELVELDTDRKWRLLKHYYDAANLFYDVNGQVVSDEEIDVAIRNFKEKPKPVIRKLIPMKEWKFILDEKDEGVRKGYFSSAFDEDAWQDVTVPHSCRHIPEDPVEFGKSCDPIYNLGLPKDEVMTIWRGDYATWYKTRIRTGCINKDSIAYIRFDSINLVSSVWVNDVPVMLDHHGLFPFEIEVTNELAFGGREKAVIAVKAENIASNVPQFFSNGLQVVYQNQPYLGKVNNWFMHDDTFSGIAGDATVTIRKRNHIDTAFFITESLQGREAFMKCRVNLRNVTWAEFVGKVIIEISRWRQGDAEIIKTVKFDVRTLPMNECEHTIDFKIDEADMWDTDHPNLYLAHITLEDETGNALDDLYESFGIRTIQVHGSSIYLNNKKIVPRGTHDQTHYHGESIICPSDYIIVKDILLHKKLGAICSRWPSDAKVHYKKIADYCDQMGYMLSWTGYFEEWQLHPAAEMHAARDVKELVRSLRNCPSIIFWEMGDEPYMCMHEYKRLRWYELMYRLVSNEDQTRPIIPAGSWCQDLFFRISEKIGQNADMPDNAEANERIDRIRAEVLDELPVYQSDLAVWDLHIIPHGTLNPKTCLEHVNLVKRNFGGKRFTVFTEFGIDALPDPENVKDIYDGFVWASSTYWPHGKHGSDMGYYGRDLTQADWKETQACQAIVLSNLICNLRENPDYFGAFYFLCMIDWSTHYVGIVDAAQNCKLAYFAVQDCYNPIYVSCLHGNTVIKHTDTVEVTASNYAEALHDLKLEVTIKDSSYCVVLKRSFDILEIEGDCKVTKLCGFQTNELEPQILSFESRLYRGDGSELCKNLELCYIET